MFMLSLAGTTVGYLSVSSSYVTHPDVVLSPLAGFKPNFRQSPL